MKISKIFLKFSTEILLKFFLSKYSKFFLHAFPNQYLKHFSHSINLCKKNFLFINIHSTNFSPSRIFNPHLPTFLFLHHRHPILFPLIFILHALWIHFQYFFLSKWVIFVIKSECHIWRMVMMELFLACEWIKMRWGGKMIRERF